jgi:hypothetical protein
MGYQETEVFEIPRVVSPGSLTHSRAAVEALFTDLGSGDMKASTEHVLEQLYPGESELGRRKALNELVQKTGNYQHLARHRSAPAVPIERNDALLSMRLTLSVFDFVARQRGRLGKPGEKTG